MPVEADQVLRATDPQVASQAGADLAYCESDGRLYSTPVSFVIVASSDLR